MTASKEIQKKYWLWFGVLASIYLFTPFFTPISVATRDRFPELAANPLFLRLFQASILIPVVLIWVAAVYGVSKFKTYAYSIRDSKDGKALDVVSNGLTVLVYGGIVLSAGSAIYSILATTAPSAARTIITNYFTLTYSLVAYGLMLKGSWELAVQVKGKDGVRKAVMHGAIPFILFAGFYVWMVFNNEFRNATPDPSRIASLYLPDYLIVLTIVVPYITIWIAGIVSAISLNVYQKLTRGAIYKQAMSRLSVGILLIIGFSIFMQMLSTIGSVFAKYNLSAFLGLIFVILLLYAICFMVVASGARKLSKIEEVQ